mgnify:CR=1 FL=1
MADKTANLKMKRRVDFGGMLRYYYYGRHCCYGALVSYSLKQVSMKEKKQQLQLQLHPSNRKILVVAGEKPIATS